MLTAIEEAEKMIGLKPQVEADEPHVPSAADNDAALAELRTMMAGVR